VHLALRIDRSASRGKSLTEYLTAEHPLCGGVRLPAAEQVDVDHLQVEQLDQILQGLGHASS
jgi:hypothetical protein